MDHTVSAGTAPDPRPAPPRARDARDHNGGFTSIAAVGAAFAGFASHSRNPDALATALAVGITFVGALIGLHVLRVVFRVVVGIARFAVPVAAILAVGCALDWPWAETATRWLCAAGGRGLDLAADGWAALRAR